MSDKIIPSKIKWS